MTTGAAARPFARTRTRWTRGQTEGLADGSRALRVGVERGMVATLAVTWPLLLLQSLPAFLAERAPGTVLPAVSLLLAVASCCFVPIALLRSGMPGRGWLLAASVASFAMVALEGVQVRAVLPPGFTPWLVGLSFVSFACIVLSTDRSRGAIVGCTALAIGLVVAYAGRLPLVQIVVDAAGLAVLACGSVAVVRVLRWRADSADEAQRAAQERFDASRRQLALEEERVRTDALLHDSVLTTLLVAAGGGDSPEQAVALARNALEVVSGARGGPTERDHVQTFERAVAAAEREIAPMRAQVRLDLRAAHEVELPGRVGDTLVAAMLQALSNSIKHAGPRTTRVARAVPIGGGGIRITVRDDGQGFDVDRIAPERLGVRVSILERVRLIGGVAEIRSTPGGGTTVLLEWTPQGSDAVEAHALAHA